MATLNSQTRSAWAAKDLRNHAARRARTRRDALLAPLSPPLRGCRSGRRCAASDRRRVVDRDVRDRSDVVSRAGARSGPDAARHPRLHLERRSGPALFPDKLNDLGARLDPLLERARQQNSGVIRINLFARDGTILYSDLGSLRGQVVSPLADPRLGNGLAGEASTEFSSLGGPENADLAGSAASRPSRGWAWLQQKLDCRVPRSTNHLMSAGRHKRETYRDDG